jgi:hypothetical protein
MDIKNYKHNNKPACDFWALHNPCRVGHVNRNWQIILPPQTVYNLCIWIDEHYKNPRWQNLEVYSVNTGSNQAGIPTRDRNVRDYPQPLQTNYGKTA